MMDYEQKRFGPGPTLEMTGVTVEPQPAFDVGLSNVDLTLQSGQLAVIILEHGAWDHPLADVVSGLTPVLSGGFKVFGQTWQALRPDHQSRARGKIGRVFEGHGWMSNLDVDENITLSQRHHTNRPWSEIQSEAETLARLVGLDGLPSARPSAVAREELRRCEWVRAAMGFPWLIILERPGQGLADGWWNTLHPLVSQSLHHGAAIIWMAEDEDEIRAETLKPSLILRAQGDKLLPEDKS